MGRYRNVLRQSRQILSNRKGKGPWMVWFPKKKPKYISKPIKTKGDLQALGSWLASKTDDRYWHNNIFNDYKNVYYNKSFTEDQGKLLYDALIANNDWDSVDLSDPIKIEKSKLPKLVNQEVEQMSFL
jgi:hypothetical protein